MKAKSSKVIRRHASIAALTLVAALLTLLIPRTASAQTTLFDYTGAETTSTLGPGTYDITAYGAQGGSSSVPGGLGAEMEGEFSFSASTTLTLLVGGAGGSFVVEGSTPLVIAGGGGGSGYWNGGGGGGSIIDSSAIMVLAEVSGVASPDDSPNGEIIITAVPEPSTWALVGLGLSALLVFRRPKA